MSKMDDLELVALLRKKEESAAAYVHGQLGSERETALREYYRLPYGNEQDGWSQIVASDVQDTVEWILPALLKTFSSTDKAVSFEPTKHEDVQGAKQATDACNYVFYKQNNGFLILYTAIKDMLTVRNCAVMWRKETVETVSSIPFKGASQEILAMLMQEQDAEIQDATPAPAVDEQGQPQIDMFGQPVVVYNGRLKKTEKKTICKVEAFSPEDLLVDREWISPLLDECPYVARLMPVTITDLKMMGFKDVTPADLRGSDLVGGQSADANFRLNKVNQSGDSTSDFVTSDYDDDDSMAEGWLRMEWVLVDADGDGVAERICVYRLADKILKQEVVSQVPIATSSPVLNTHRWDGMSMADAVSDLQKLHTELLRQTLNNLYLTNNPRTKVLTDANWSPLANIDDLLDSRAGGVIRQRDINAVTEQVTPFSAGASMPMLEYVQGMRENRTGVSRTSMGLNPDSLNNTATGRQIDQSASMQRLELIARIIAETLVKPIFKGILKLLTEGDMEKLAFRLNDEFIEYDPNEWRDSYDMTINVGLGTGDTMQKSAQLTQIWQLQTAAMQFGLATPGHLYNTAAKTIENAGFKDIQNFIQDPSKQPPQPQQPPLPIQIEQMKIQGDAQKFQAQTANEQQKMEMQDQQHQREVQRDMELERNKQELQARDTQHTAQLEAQKAQYMAQLENQRIMAEMEHQIQIERMKIEAAKDLKELDIAGRIQVAQISAQQAISLASMAAQESASNELAGEFNDTETDD